MRDHQHGGRDVYVHLAMAASQTSRIALFPCVTNPLTRHPMVLASLANSLEELAPGRMRLIVGAGDQSARHIGRPAATVAELRAAVVSMRALLAGQAVVIGASAEERLANIAPRPVPIHINASSPRMIRLAGEVADGVLLMVGRQPGVVQAAYEELRAGAELAGRTLDGLDVTYALPTFIDSTRERARERAKGILRFWLDRPRRLYTRYAAADGQALSEAQLVDGMGLVGTAEECAEALQAFVEQTGARHVVCQIYGSDQDPRETLAAFEHTIVPRVR